MQHRAKQILPFVVSAFAFFHTTLGHSREILQLFEKLKTVPVSYSTYGTVCEQAARLEFEVLYPKKEFKIETGISFSHHPFHQGDVAGEMDLVVFKNKENDREPDAYLIAEVKCTSSFELAHKKAVDQLNHMRDFLKSKNESKYFFSSRKHFSPSQFNRVERFITVAPIGGQEAGFDVLLGYTQPEFKALREMILEWRGLPEQFHSFYPHIETKIPSRHQRQAGSPKLKPVRMPSPPPEASSSLPDN
jgi:hypothetical protein